MEQEFFEIRYTNRVGDDQLELWDEPDEAVERLLDLRKCTEPNVARTARLAVPEDALDRRVIWLLGEFAEAMSGRKDPEYDCEENVLSMRAPAAPRAVPIGGRMAFLFDS